MVAHESHLHLFRHLDGTSRLFYELPDLTETDRQTRAAYVSAPTRVLALRGAEMKHPFSEKRDKAQDEWRAWSESRKQSNPTTDTNADEEGGT